MSHMLWVYVVDIRLIQVRDTELEELEEFQQEIMENSTTEVEYIIAFEAAKEVVWIRKFIDELRVALLIQ